MRRRIVIQKSMVFMLTAIFAIYGITGISAAHHANFLNHNATRSISEAAASGTNVGSAVTATDFEEAFDRYRLRARDRLTNSTDAASFSIGSSTGQLTTATTLDYETKSSYSLTVIVENGLAVGNPANPTIVYFNPDEIDVTINVTDVDLQFSDGDSTSRSIDEHEDSGTDVGSVITASNFDSTRDRYTVSGTDARSFSINSTTGQLTSSAEFDYEVKSSYSINVNVFAGAQTAAEDTISVTVNITDTTDTSCPPGYSLYKDDCLKHAYGSGFGEADALPGFTAEEQARIVEAITLETVIFNELFNGTNDVQDWVELRNITDADVDLSGWRLIVATEASTTAFTVPEGVLLPAGEVLLFLNTDPTHPDMPLATADDAAYQYLVNAGFHLPPTAFTLILRSPEAWEDSGGNFFFGYETPPTVPVLTDDVAWVRIRPNVIGTRVEAWEASGYQDGLGYDAHISEAISLGTPGYHTQQTRTADVNSDGVVNILDLVFVASHFGESNVPAADLNGDGEVNIQDLVLVANAFGDVTTAP